MLKKVFLTALFVIMVTQSQASAFLIMELWGNGQPGEVTISPGDTLLVDVILTPLIPVDIVAIEFDLDDPAYTLFFTATHMFCHVNPGDCIMLGTPVNLSYPNSRLGMLSMSEPFPVAPLPAFTIAVEIDSYATPGTYEIVPSNVMAYDAAYNVVDILDSPPLVIHIGDAPQPATVGDFNWEIQSVAPAYDASNAMTFLPTGQPAIAFSGGSWSNRKLSYTWLEDNVWQTVDVASVNASHCSLAILPNGQPAISLYDDNYSTGRNLRYFWHDGTSWQGQLVDSDANVGKWNSLAILPNGEPAISYYDSANRDLKYAWFDGTDWQIEVVDSTGNVGQYTSLVVLPNGSPAISYQDATNGDVKYAWHDGNAWQSMAVDYMSYGASTSMVVLPDGQPAISYISGSYLKYARFDGANWVKSIAYNSSKSFYGNSLSVLPSGHPAIAFMIGGSSDEYEDELVYVAWNGSSWDKLLVDSFGKTGQSPSLAIGPDGLPAISFCDVREGQKSVCFAKFIAREPAPVEMMMDYTAYANTDYSAPVTISNGPAHSEGTDWPDQWAGATGNFITVPEDHLRANIILKGRPGHWSHPECMEWDPETGECLWWEEFPMDEPAGVAEGSIGGTIDIGISANYPAGSPLDLTCQAIVRGTVGRLFYYTLKVLRGDDTIALINQTSPEDQTVSIFAGEQLNFSISGRTKDSNYEGYDIHIDGRFLLAGEPSPSTQLVSAVSRKMHGEAGILDIDLPLDSAESGLEPRAGGPTMIVLTFSEELDPATNCANVLLSSGTCEDVAVNGSEMTVTLSGVTGNACLSLTLDGVVSAAAVPLAGDNDVHVRVLLGKANSGETGAVDISDLSAVKGHLFQPVTSDNCRCDVYPDGVINIRDLSLTRSNMLNTATCE